MMNTTIAVGYCRANSKNQYSKFLFDWDWTGRWSHINLDGKRCVHDATRIDTHYMTVLYDLEYCGA